MKRTHKSKSKAVREKIMEESPPQKEDGYEEAIEQILETERTEDPTTEGYHFIRPSWHRTVYGGGKSDK